MKTFVETFCFQLFLCYCIDTIYVQNSDPVCTMRLGVIWESEVIYSKLLQGSDQDR